MFDIGFFELFVVVVIGLFVIGPERLPSALRTGALWLGRIRHMLRETRSELEKHIGADEIRRELHNEQVMRSLESLKRSKDDLLNAVSEQKNSILAPSAINSDEPPDYYPHDDNGLAITDPAAVKTIADVTSGEPNAEQKTETANSDKTSTPPAVESQLSPETEAYLASQKTLSKSNEPVSNTPPNTPAK